VVSFVGPTARLYVLPRESLTELTTLAVSFHPTITTFRFPAVCAPGYATVTVVCDVCGTADLPWTYATAAESPCGNRAPVAAMKNKKKHRVRPGVL